MSQPIDLVAPIVLGFGGSHARRVPLDEVKRDSRGAECEDQRGGQAEAQRHGRYGGEAPGGCLPARMSDMPRARL